VGRLDYKGWVFRTIDVKEEKWGEGGTKRKIGGHAGQNYGWRKFLRRPLGKRE